MSKETLYVLMRNDMESLTAGKACAQAAHASNAAKHHVMTKITDKVTIEDFSFWESQTDQGFGTTIVLGVTEQEMRDCVEILSKSFVAGIVHDPSYPVRDGKIMHLIPVDTCAYVYTSDREQPLIKMILKKLNLY
jgi:hypothetical protein